MCVCFFFRFYRTNLEKLSWIFLNRFRKLNLELKKPGAGLVPAPYFWQIIAAGFNISKQKAPAAFIMYPFECRATRPTTVVYNTTVIRWAVDKLIARLVELQLVRLRPSWAPAGKRSMREALQRGRSYESDGGVYDKTPKAKRRRQVSTLAFCIRRRDPPPLYAVICPRNVLYGIKICITRIVLNFFLEKFSRIVSQCFWGTGFG